MRWLADECVYASVVSHLRKTDHDVLYAAEASAGASDEAIVTLAGREARILLTRDTDFGDLVIRRRQKVPGLILLRLDPSAPSFHWQRLEHAIAMLGSSLLGRYTVVERQRFRSRRLPDVSR